MSRWYLDTSAALKLVVEEAESASLAASLNAHTPELAGSLLLETELRRAVHRDAALTQELVSEFLEGVDLYELPVPMFHEAGLLSGAHMRSLDALHLAAAVRIGVDRVVTYDLRMADAAQDLGLKVWAPS